MFMGVLGQYAISTVLLVPKGLLEGADCIGGQLHGDKECLFSGITNSGRVWRKVPESDAGSVSLSHTHILLVLPLLIFLLHPDFLLLIFLAPCLTDGP